MFATSQIFQLEAAVQPTQTTFGVLQSSDLAELSKFALEYNDFLTPRVLHTEEMIFFSTNELNTQSTSHEFMVCGSIENDSRLPANAVFFMISGAFHSSNNSLDVFDQLKIDVDTTYFRLDDTEVGNRPEGEWKKDGFRGLIEDPQNPMNTITTLSFS